MSALSRRGWVTVLAGLALAGLLLVMGAALRPLVAPERHTPAPVLDAVEIGFAQDMVTHHQQALLMVGRLDPGVTPGVRGLAQQIDDTQRVEIGTMLGWLRLAGASPLPEHPMGWLTASSEGAHAHGSAAPVAAITGAVMPGMASVAELDALAAARGHEAEVLFLELMIRHHEAGARMALAADALLASGAVKEAARAMVRAQGQEIAIMSLMLDQLSA